MPSLTRLACPNFGGCYFLLKKQNAGGHLGWTPKVLRSDHTATKAWLMGGQACLATGWTNLKNQNGLIGRLTSPNEVPISSPCSKFTGYAKYGLPGHKKNLKNWLGLGPWANVPMGPWASALGPEPMGPLSEPWAHGPFIWVCLAQQRRSQGQ